jgi:YegS/Rv2252/BmrU family lipid kinase
MTVTAVGSVAVIAHTGKELPGGLPALRDCLGAAGITDVHWYEVDKSKRAPKQVRRARDAGAELFFVWGGDGMVQRCIDALAGSHATVAILPAGTANLLATNLEIPKEIEAAVDVGLHGARRQLDTGLLNGEHFAVMAGAGFDALMLRSAPRRVKDRLGRLAYVWTGAKHLGMKPVRMKIKVDGSKWFDGRASCVLVGNVGTLIGGVTAFDDAKPDDGVLDIGVVTADGVWQWTRALVRTAVGRAERSPFVQTTTGRSFDVRLKRPLPFELDGGDRPAAKRLRVRVAPASIRIAVPEPSP